MHVTDRKGSLTHDCMYLKPCSQSAIWYFYSLDYSTGMLTVSSNNNWCWDQQWRSLKWWILYWYPTKAHYWTGFLLLEWTSKCLIYSLHISWKLYLSVDDLFICIVGILLLHDFMCAIKQNYGEKVIIQVSC